MIQMLLLLLNQLTASIPHINVRTQMNKLKELWNKLHELNACNHQTCSVCSNIGLMRYNGSPSESLMGPCEYCSNGLEVAVELELMNGER